MILRAIIAATRSGSILKTKYDTKVFLFKKGNCETKNCTSEMIEPFSPINLYAFDWFMCTCAVTRFIKMYVQDKLHVPTRMWSTQTEKKTLSDHV